MSDDRVQAEVNAVRTLRRGVSRYAEQLRETAAQARWKICEVDRRAHEAVERRRSDLQRRERELKAAQAALTRSPGGPGGAQREVEEATRRNAEARQNLDRARKAAELTATARADLLKTLQRVESAVGEQSSVAASALANLDVKLSAFPQLDVGHALHNVAAGTVVAVEILTAGMDLAYMTGNAARALGVPTPLGDQSLAEMAERRRDQEVDYVVQLHDEQRKRLNSGEGQETTA